MQRRNVERNVLFLCEDNACLSQMAEAAAKHLAPPRTRIFSAGVQPRAIPLPVVEAMQELGISMGGQKSKSLADVPIGEIDLVVSFDDAHKRCGDLPGRVRIARWAYPQVRKHRTMPARLYRRCAAVATKSTSASSHCFSTTGEMC
jgi:arsenate reductase